MISRRKALAMCVCGACAPLFPQGVVSQELDEDFFYCDTPQITSIGIATQNFSAAGQIGTDDFAATGASLGTDDYATATQALRWTKAKTKSDRGGLPLVLIAFVDGSSAEQQAIIDISKDWAQADIALAFDYTNDLSKSHVRISFSGGVNKSKTGIEALAAKGSTTMWLPEVRSRPGTTAARRAVLHEFGHGLMTFGHEHRHPGAGYKFKSAEEIRDIINAGPARGGALWTTEMVQTNITNPPYPVNRACTAYDVKSIMHYPVQSSWLLAGTPVPQPETSLSQLDLACASATYAS